MKLRNKNGDAIGILKYVNENGKSWFEVKTGNHTIYYYSIAKLNEEWEDYKEPKKLYVLDGRQSTCWGILERDDNTDWYDNMVELGLGFETCEEVEKAVEKLKAWTRLKDKGARFKEWFWDENYGTCIIIGDSESSYIDDGDDQNKKDLDLLFGGEE